MELWQQVVASLIAAFICTVAGFLLWLFLRLFKKKPPPDSGVVGPATTGPDSPLQISNGKGNTPTQIINQPEGKSPIIIAQPGSNVTVTINIIDYQDGLSQAPIAQVKTLFEQGRKYFVAKQFDKAIEKFTSAIQLEKDHEKLGALNLQIGNCYYEQRHFIKAAEFYATALREAHQSNDREGQASALVSLANTYIPRPASDGSVRGQNVKQAVQHYKESLQIFTKDKYPIQYAMTQNNLGTAYTDLPAETSQQRTENVHKAIECYKAALEIRKKDEYPQDYCFTAANIGLVLAEINDKNACYWLKEAYALRQFLPDQGKRLENLMNKICD